MRLSNMRRCALTFVICLGLAQAPAFGAAGCDEDAIGAAPETERRFVVLAARRGVFHDGGGPTAVALIKVDSAAQELETGAVGIYADEEGRRTFGAVPPRVYDGLARDADHADEVMLRFEVTAPQHQRVLEVLSTWNRRARENVLLYPDLAMNTILFVKQAVEAVNHCGEVVDLYVLDWGIEDAISDNNYAGVVPFLYFEELKRRNGELHVPDDGAPSGVLLAAAGGAAPEAEQTEP